MRVMVVNLALPKLYLRLNPNPNPGLPPKRDPTVELAD